MIEINIRENLTETIAPADLEAFVRQVLEITQTPPETGISLNFTDDDEIQALNLEYLGVDAPTDVLSFVLDFQNPETGAYHLGDIVISLPAAARQAVAGGHPLADEVKLLLTHGILHLLGYDHSDPGEKSAMWQIQDQILTALGVQARPTES